MFKMMIPRTSIPEEFDSQRYQSLPLAHSVDNGEEMPPDDPGVIHVIPESGRSEWEKKPIPFHSLCIYA